MTIDSLVTSITRCLWWAPLATLLALSGCRGDSPLVAERDAAGTGETLPVVDAGPPDEAPAQPEADAGWPADAPAGPEATPSEADGPGTELDAVSGETLAGDDAGDLAGDDAGEPPAGTPAEGPPRPEVGRLVRKARTCTATLVLPGYVLTVGQCFRLPLESTEGDSFVLSLPDGSERRFAVAGVFSFGGSFSALGGALIAPDRVPDGSGTNDLALVRLAEPVPPEVARPLRIASVPPAAGEPAVLVAYDCTESAPNLRQSHGFTIGAELPGACPRGMGGALLAGPPAAPALVGLRSTASPGRPDRNSSVTWFKEAILAVAARQDAAGSPVEVERGGPDLPEPALPRVDVQACLTACQQHPDCAAFSFTPAGPGRPARCRLKPQVLDWSPCPGCIAGTELALEPGTNRPGLDFLYIDLPEKRAELCLAHCAREPRCRAYTFVEADVGTGMPRCWLKHEVPAAALVGGMTSGVRRGMVSNFAVSGPDAVPPFPLDPGSGEGCRRACAENERCRAFTFAAAEAGGRPLCALKSAVAGGELKVGALSGIKRPLELGVDRGGLDYRAFELDAALPELCQAACARESECVAFAYVRPGVQGDRARCWLKSGVPLGLPDDAIASGLKGREFF